MRLRIFITTLLFFFIAGSIYAGPARRGRMTLIQPDGSSFTALFKGDEFTKIKTTTDGHAIIQDKDGWWCYAAYDSQGNKTGSGFKVGDKVPGEVIAQSRSIPYGVLSAAAAERKTRKIKSLSKVRMGLMNQTVDTTTVKVRKGLIILADFQDIRFTYTKEDFEAMIFQEGYNINGATGSAKEYFEAQFGGLVEFDFTVSDIVTLNENREYYGKNKSNGDDIRPAELVKDACLLADETVDFSQFDEDGDGTVDNVFVFFAGEDEAEGGDEDCIWSHSWSIEDGTQEELLLDGCMIDGYACSSELTRRYDNLGQLEGIYLSAIGIFCHEYCHTLGLPDLYDTDYDDAGGWAAGLWGTTSIMDYGSRNNNCNTPPNFNAIEREILGSGTSSLIYREGLYYLRSIHNGKFFRMETDTEGEYYLFEYRDSSNIWDSHIGGSGMLVYHIDRSEGMADRWDIHNTINSDATHQCADLVEADGRADYYWGPDDYLIRRGSTDGIFFPYNDLDSLNATGRPGLGFWSGDHGRLSINKIHRSEDGQIVFNVKNDSVYVYPPLVRNTIRYEAFSDAAIILFDSTREETVDAVVSYGLTGKDTTRVYGREYDTKRYAVMIEGLLPDREYTVSMAFHLNGIEGKSKSISFKTKKSSGFEYPYIDFGKAVRNSDGTFPQGSRIPLKVGNAKGAADIRWTFRGEDIEPEGDYYHTLIGSGILKAYITWEDGSEDIIYKVITVSTL